MVCAFWIFNKSSPQHYLSFKLSLKFKYLKGDFIFLIVKFLFLALFLWFLVICKKCEKYLCDLLFYIISIKNLKRSKSLLTSKAYATSIIYRQHTTKFNIVHMSIVQSIRIFDFPKIS